MKYKQSKKRICRNNTKHKWWQFFDEYDYKDPATCPICKIKGHSYSLGVYFYYDLAVLGLNKTSKMLKLEPVNSYE